MQNNTLIHEIDYSKTQIKKLTPYLNDITIPPKSKNDKPKHLTLFHRAFAWYYIHNNNNKADAYKRAKYGIYDKNTNTIKIKIPPKYENKKKGRNFNRDSAILSGELCTKLYIKEAIARVRRNHIDNIKIDLPQTFIQQLQIQATYDPEMFYTPDGKPAFSEWSEVPKEYRCCIEHLETKYYGKDADRKVIIMKLVDRKSARQELYKFVDSALLNPEKFEVIHKTLNKQGQEVGLNEEQVKNMSDRELTDLVSKLSNQVTKEELAEVL